MEGQRSHLSATGSRKRGRSVRAGLCKKFHPRPRVDDKPQDWWFASTAIPLIAATTAPFANVISIVALVMSWRSTLHFDEKTKDDLPLQVPYDDPHWGIALNATSLVCGVAGNLFLLCNFTGAVRYIIALPCSIVLWYLATAILIGVTSAIHMYMPPTLPHQTYTQGFWFAVIAAVLYFVLALILTVNLLGYLLGHYPQKFTLTDSQRTLILQTTALGVWLIVGAAIFQRLIGLNFGDALYFSDITILTLGFGDITATTPVARGIIFPYAVIGIIMLGLVVGSTNRSFHEVQYNNVIRKRMEERRKALIKRSSPTVDTEHPDECNADIAPETPGSRQTRHRSRSFAFRMIIALYQKVVGQTSVISVNTERERFDAIRIIQHETVRFHRWYRLTLSLIAFGLVWTCGAAVFCSLEDDLTYFSALYFNFVCLLSVGYGDITPTTNAGKAFFVIWSLIAVPTMTTLISEMSDTVIAVFQHLTNLFAKWTLLPQIEIWNMTRRDAPSRPLIVRVPPILNFLEMGEGQGFEHHVQGIGEERAHNAAPSVTLGDIDSTGFHLARKLVSAVSRAGADVASGTPGQYTYEEWAEFSRVIRSTIPILDADIPREDEYGVWSWDWLGENSPMLASQTEPEWVLGRLCESLSRYIDVLASRHSGKDKKNSGYEYECPGSKEE
ncbi:hypothetical protein BDV59DRAFT_210064 [Aspergillus ambiguus]|uniref:uncharacterized protein n=1 Tax=Aspergillus ambiguus TaxID=176160 RepID=UPI003CCD9080